MLLKGLYEDYLHLNQEYDRKVNIVTIIYHIPLVLDYQLRKKKKIMILSTKTVHEKC